MTSLKPTRLFGVIGLTLFACLICAVSARADAVLDWNEIAVRTAIANGQNPFAQARTGAIVQLAVFEAVNSITGDYQPYVGTIAAEPSASPDAAAIQAAYRVLRTFFPGSAAQLDAAHTLSLSLIPDSQSKTDGMTTGDAAANAVMALRANDGSSPPQFKVPGPAVPGEYQATPSCPAINGIAVGTLFQWQYMTPFGIQRVSDYLLPPPPSLTSNTYTKAYNEVLVVGSADSIERTQDRADVVHLYAVSGPNLVFGEALRQIATQEQRSLTENARALALLSMAINDSLVASFFNKYHYNYWRPETAIRAGDTDDNDKTQADPSFLPFILTPCFPSYPSNHGSSTNAAAEVMRRLYGEAGHSITVTNPAVPTIVLQYTSFRQIADDVSDARVYGGIHFLTDQVAGAELGRAIATEVYRNNLRPIHGDH